MWKQEDISKSFLSLPRIVFLAQKTILLPITVAERSEVGNIFTHSNSKIVGSNPTRRMDVYLRFFWVCFLLCTYGPCEGMIPRLRNPISCKIHSYRSILKGNRPEGLIRQRKKTMKKNITTKFVDIFIIQAGCFSWSSYLMTFQGSTLICSCIISAFEVRLAAMMVLIMVRGKIQR